VTQRTDTSDWPCPIARGVDVLGDGWTLLILRDACLGVRRFDDFQRSLGIGRNILSKRLQQLVDDGLFTRTAYSEHPNRFEYRLTEKGRDAFAVLAAMATWSERWNPHPDGPILHWRHTTCDHDMHAAVVCDHCGEGIDVRQVRARPGPGFPTKG
jgi:DNA-binding HxlR family transcriptional regulator